MKKTVTDGSFLDHLEELRQRILLILLWFFVASCLVYVFKNQLLKVILQPLGGLQEKIVFVSPVEPFFSVIKVSLFCGFLLSFPFMLYQLYLFVKPALKPTQAKVMLWSTVASQVLFYAGALFAHFFIVPAGLRILFSFGTGLMQPMITIGYYLSFLMWMIMGISIVFQVPVVMTFLVISEILSLEALARIRKPVIVGSFVVAALITPTTDMITQIIIAGIMVVLYEITILILRIIYKYKLLIKDNLY